LRRRRLLVRRSSFSELTNFPTCHFCGGRSLPSLGTVDRTENVNRQRLSASRSDPTLGKKLFVSSVVPRSRCFFYLLLAPPLPESPFSSGHRSYDCDNRWSMCTNCIDNGFVLLDFPYVRSFFFLRRLRATSFPLFGLRK